MQHTAKMERWIRAEQLEPEAWVTVQEAARILGTTEMCVRHNLGCLEGTKIGHPLFHRQRWIVKLAKVEWLKRVRAGDVKVVKPPEEEEWPNEIGVDKAGGSDRRDGRDRSDEVCAEAHTANPSSSSSSSSRSRLTGTEYLRRVWVDYDANDTWVTTDQAASVLGVLPGQVARMGWRGKLTRRWADRRTGQPIADCGLRIADCADTDVRLEGVRIANNQERSRWRAMYSLRQIDALAEERRKPGFSPHDQERPGVVPGFRDWNDHLPALRRVGRLQGNRLGPQAKQKFNRRRYWYFLKADIEAFKCDPIHEKYRRGYLRNLRPWEYEEPHVGPYVEEYVTPGEKTYIPHDPRNRFYLETPLQKLRREMGEW